MEISWEYSKKFLNLNSQYVRWSRFFLLISRLLTGAWLDTCFSEGLFMFFFLFWKVKRVCKINFLFNNINKFKYRFLEFSDFSTTTKLDKISIIRKSYFEQENATFAPFGNLFFIFLSNSSFETLATFGHLSK